MKRIPILISALVLATGVASGLPASARADGGDNSAIAVNTKNGATIIKVAFAIRHVMSGIVDQSNVAVAYASCTQCTTVAIAIEIVLIESNATVITPTNLAIAFNQNCTLCLTVADAMQFLLSTGGPVHFDADGNRILADVRQELERLKHENLSLAELQAAIARIQSQIQDVLANHLVPAGRPEDQTSEPTSTNTTSTPTSTLTTTTMPTATTTNTPTTTTTGVTTTTGP